MSSGGAIMGDIVHGSYEPQNLEAAMVLAERLRCSALVPRSLKSPADVLVVMMTGRELGLGTMQALRSVHVIEGKPTLSADLMAGLCARSAVCEHFAVVEMTPTVATVETLRKGHPAPLRFSYTIEQARGAGLAGKDNWRKYPEQMLKARAVSIAARAVYPDLMMGIYDPDELGAEVTIDADGDIVDVEIVEDNEGGGRPTAGGVTTPEPPPSTSPPAGGTTENGGPQTPPAGTHRGADADGVRFDRNGAPHASGAALVAYLDRHGVPFPAYLQWREANKLKALTDENDSFACGGSIVKLREGRLAEVLAWMDQQHGGGR
jgi:hypothetical protein